MATTLPQRKPMTRTKGSALVKAHIDSKGERQVAVYIPLEWHTALLEATKRKHGALQSNILTACSTYYGVVPPVLPPLVEPTHVRRDPHKTVTWYAATPLHDAMKKLAVDIRSSVQQLVLSALVDHMKNEPAIAALKIPTGSAPYPKAPA